MVKIGHFSYFKFNIGIAYLENVYVVVTSSEWRNVINVTPVWPDFYKLLFKKEIVKIGPFFKFNIGNAYLENVYVIVTSSAWRNVKNVTPLWPDFYKLLFKKKSWKSDHFSLFEFNIGFAYLENVYVIVTS